jgi:adenosylmethionine-8-amino-7-oxononanoate aminotransferase
MRCIRPTFIQQAIRLVRHHGILVIFDEIMTGFCRTGTYFALDQLQLVPDFLCLSKGITGGFLPLALTVTQPKIYDAFLGDDQRTAFAHGHSYTANPLACSAALASLSLLQAPACQSAIDQIHRAHRLGLNRLKAACPRVEKIRHLGTIAAFDIQNAEGKMASLKQRCLEEGMLLRPLGGTVYLLPPYCITPDELESVYDRIIRIIHTIAFPNAIDSFNQEPHA